jgi:hypothetical protein
MVLTPLTLAFSGWGRCFSLDSQRAGNHERPPHQPWLTALLALLIGLAFLTGGLGKIRGGWLRPESLATRWYVLGNTRVDGRGTPVAAWALQHLPRTAWKALDWATVLWETAFFLTAPRRTAFRVACAFGALFHFCVWLLFDIKFDTNAVAYGAFVSWAVVWPFNTLGFRALLGSPPRSVTVLLCLAPAGVALFSLLVLGADPSTALALHLDGVILVIGLTIAVAYAAHLARLPRREGRPQLG